MLKKYFFKHYHDDEKFKKDYEFYSKNYNVEILPGIKNNKVKVKYKLKEFDEVIFEYIQ